jgi:hypothetical protein
MTITSSRLTAASGACAATGAIFIAVQVNHPPVDVAHLGSTDLFVRETANAAMAVLPMAVVDEALGGPANGQIGHVHELFLVSGIGYVFGGLLFGIALFRARVVTRWAAALLAYGTTSALGLVVLPQSFSRPFAVPTGVALIGLGVSTWRGARPHVDEAATVVASPPVAVR